MHKRTDKRIDRQTFLGKCYFRCKTMIIQECKIIAILTFLINTGIIKNENNATLNLYYCLLSIINPEIGKILWAKCIQAFQGQVIFFNQSTYLFHKKKHMSPLNFEEILFISCFYLIDAIKIRQRFILFILGTLIKTPLQSKIRFIIYIRLCSTNNIKWFPNHRVYHNKNKSIYWTCYLLCHKI